MTKQNDRMGWSILKWILNVVAIVAIPLSAWTLTLLIEVQQNVKLQAQALQNLSINIQRLEKQSADHAKILIELSKWQAATEASRFTKLDGEKLKSQMGNLTLRVAVADIPGIKERIKRLELSISKHKQPEW